MVLAALLLLVQAPPAKETVRIPDTTVSFEMVRLEGPGLRPFSIGVTEVSWGEFNAFYKNRRGTALDGVTRPSDGQSILVETGLPAAFQEPRRPVTNARWHTAVAYCEWLSKKTGRTFRLPTEKEWEFAARAGGEPTGWHAGTSDKRTHVVGESKPNAAGIHDLFGNVWEYCLEFDQEAEFRPVLRGGSWASPAAEASVAGRRKVTMDWFECDVNRPRSLWWLYSDRPEQGFRVVCVPDAADVQEREAASKRIQFKFLGSREVELWTGASKEFISRVRIDVTNNTGKDLDELEVRVFYLTPAGKPHPIDLGAHEHPTFSSCWPVLANSAHKNPSVPLRSKVTRTFEIDLPSTFDDVSEVDPDKFGASVMSLKFSKEEKR